ncbi:hypothetical protein ACHQM5_022884 [Ranunculus cassubicifolius]
MMELEEVLQSSEGHKEWVKHLHWTYSEPSMVHFFVRPLMPGFQQKVVIPRKFVTEFKTKLSDVVALRGLNGKSWKVRVTQDGDNFVLGDGWGDFAKDHFLEMYYVLVFRYDELEECFDVLVFDRNGCEKEVDGSSILNADIPRVYLFYRDLIQGLQRLCFPRKFVRMFGEKLPEMILLKGPKNTVWNIGLSKNDNRMFLERGWGEFVRYYTLDESDLLLFRYDEWDECFYVIMFDTTACEKKGCESAQITSNPGLLDESVRERAKEVKSEPDVAIHSVKNRLTRKERVLMEEEKSEEESDAPKAGSRQKLTYNRYFCSHRRKVTAEEKQHALRSAKAVKSTKPNFIAVMKPCHVYKRFYLTLPKNLICNYLSRQPESAFLRVPPSTKTWTVSILYKEHGQKGGISGGWARFVMDNNLEEGDVCVFEILNIREENSNSNSFYVVDMNASIHRVLDKVVPFTVRKSKP